MNRVGERDEWGFRPPLTKRERRAIELCVCGKSRCDHPTVDCKRFFPHPQPPKPPGRF